MRDKTLIGDNPTDPFTTFNPTDILTALRCVFYPEFVEGDFLPALKCVFGPELARNF